MELKNICISAHHKYAPRALALVWLVLSADPLEHLPGGWYCAEVRWGALSVSIVIQYQGIEPPVQSRTCRDYLHKLPIYAVFFRA